MLLKIHIHFLNRLVILRTTICNDMGCAAEDVFDDVIITFGAVKICCRTEQLITQDIYSYSGGLLV